MNINENQRTKIIKETVCFYPRFSKDVRWPVHLQPMARSPRFSIDAHAGLRDDWRDGIFNPPPQPPIKSIRVLYIPWMVCLVGRLSLDPPGRVGSCKSERHTIHPHPPWCVSRTGLRPDHQGRGKPNPNAVCFLHPVSATNMR